MRAGVAVFVSVALTVAGAASAQTLSNPPGADQPPPAQPGPAAAPPPPQTPDTACMPASSVPGTSRLHVEVRDEHGLYSGGETVLVTDGSGKPVVSATCGTPFANFLLAPGRYRVSAFIGDRLTNEAEVEVPRSGANAVLAFAPEPSRNDEVL